MDEDEILHWLLSHLENDEIEDIDEDTLDRMVKEGRTMAVLFCKLILFTENYIFACKLKFHIEV